MCFAVHPTFYIRTSFIMSFLLPGRGKKKESPRNVRVPASRIYERERKPFLYRRCEKQCSDRGGGQGCITLFSLFFFLSFLLSFCLNASGGLYIAALKKNLFQDADVIRFFLLSLCKVCEAMTRPLTPKNN